MDLTARIFVAGHRDIIGAAMMRLLSKEGYKNVIAGDIDLTDARATNQFFKQEQPEGLEPPTRPL